MNNKKYELLRKIKALSVFGVDGEKENAEKMLNKFMRKHGISAEDIEGEKWEEFKFKIPKEKILIKLHWQIVHFVLSQHIQFKEFTYINVRSYMVSNLPVNLGIELSMKLDFYIKAFSLDLDSFYLAFLYKNHLLLQGSDEAEHNQEVINKHKKAALMSQYLDTHNFHKQIGFETKPN
jgi:hypothetical protein